MTGALPPLWPLVAAGLAAALILAGLTARAVVRDWRQPVLDERGASARLTEGRARVENVTRRREDLA